MSTTIHCSGGCGDTLTTDDPVNRRATYICPRCLEVEVARLDERIRLRLGATS